MASRRQNPRASAEHPGPLRRRIKRKRRTADPYGRRAHHRTLATSRRGKVAAGGTMTAAPTREPFAPPEAGAPPAPRIMRLGDLLGDWEADAEAAHEARQ